MIKPLNKKTLKSHFEENSNKKQGLTAKRTRKYIVF